MRLLLSDLFRGGIGSRDRGLSALSKKNYLRAMNNIKNAIIALLTGLLALTLFTQSAQSAPIKSIEAKAMEYLFCLDQKQSNYDSNEYIDQTIKECVKYKP